MAELQAACLAVGSELLGDERLDSNSLTVTRTLARYGVRVIEKRVVGDVEQDIARAVTELLGRFGLVVVTGGLGPTADDVTRSSVAAALGRALDHDPMVEEWLRERYAVLGRDMPDLCLAMARVVVGSTPLKNSRGAAPGILVEHEDRLLAAFPGVPWELELMLERDLVPVLRERSPEWRRVRRTLLLGGVMESEIEGRIGSLYERFGRDNLTILASPGVVRMQLSAEGRTEAATERLDEMEAAFRDVLGADVAGTDVSGLGEVVLGHLREAGDTLATAESCTGGLVSAWLTDVPGSSMPFLGGVVSYSNQAKETHVGVPHAELEEHGAVSEPVARAMAAGVRERFAADWGVGITGIAGPGGGTAEKPVGLVHWAVAGPEGVWHRRRVFAGNRAIVREWSANSSLDLLRRLLIGAA